MYGHEESMNVRIEFGSSDATEPVEFFEVMDLRPTTRSRETSLARWKETLFGINLEES